MLYTVYAKDTAQPDEDWFEIGEITTTDEPFTQSLWGDERLFFQHSKIRDDLDVLGRRFLRENRRFIPEFNFEKYGKLQEHLD